MNQESKKRKEIVDNCSKVVIKVGTRLLTEPARIPVLISQLALLRKRGLEVILVSSGAVGVGMKTMGLDKRPSKLSSIQALAAIGQNKLMSVYENECTNAGFHSAQLLLTADALRHRERHLNILNCINSLLSQGILPIINENDAVSVDALKFGDNDMLAGLLATMTCSELTIILTNVDGLHSRNGDCFGDRISIVHKITDEIKAFAGGTDDSSLSIGGMISKINAAELVTASGDSLWVADGRDSDTLLRIADGEDVGTLFLPGKSKQMQSKKRWLGFFSDCKGTLVIDDGAVRALCSRGGSLLPSGLLSVEGAFERGDVVDICDQNGKSIGRGLINYNSSESAAIAGCQCSEISGILKYPADDELIHRDNLVMVN